MTIPPCFPPERAGRTDFSLHLPSGVRPFPPGARETREDHRAEFLDILNDHSGAGNLRWRALAGRVLASEPAAEDLLALFRAITDYDESFARHLNDALPLPEGAVTVSGSGKETLKTFNVSTAAAIVAAAAGATVVKGASRSVSAVSGALDVLTRLGIGIVETPAGIGSAIGRHGIAFVDYRIFCPRFFRRYDGYFTEIQPTSLFMPAVAMCVQASGFVHGLASRMSQVSAEVIARIRPRARQGVVVGAEPVPGRCIDEYVRRGRHWRSDLRGGEVRTRVQHAAPASREWAAAVAHRDSHRANTERLLAVLAGRAPAPMNELVYDNAALILEAAGTGTSYEECHDRVREAHRSGRVAALLRSLMGPPARRPAPRAEVAP